MKIVTLTLLTAGCGLAAWTGWKLGCQKTVHSPEPSGSVEASPRPAESGAAYARLAMPAPEFRGSRSLTDILKLLESRRTGAALEMSGDVLALLRELKPEEIGEALAALQRMPPPVPAACVAAVLGRYAEFDPAAAMAAALKLSGTQRDEARIAVIASWAKHDPKAAWQWYLKEWATAPEPRYQLERCFLPLIRAWAMQDPAAALAACLSEEKHGTLDPWAGFASLVALPDRRDATLAVLIGIEDKTKRASALRSALGEWSSADPAGAAAWLDASPDAKDQALIWSIAERFGRHDYQAAVEWLWNRSSPERREGDTVSMGLTQWAHADPEAAGTWLQSHPCGDAGRGTMAGAWSMVNLDRALEWTAEMTPEQKASTVVSIAANLKSFGKTPDMARLAKAAGLTEAEFNKRTAAQPMRF